MVTKIDLNTHVTPLYEILMTTSAEIPRVNILRNKVIDLHNSNFHMCLKPSYVVYTLSDVLMRENNVYEFIYSRNNCSNKLFKLLLTDKLN